MSKSLGNSPDPLELIGKYGADALRFGTMRSAPLGPGRAVRRERRRIGPQLLQQALERLPLPPNARRRGPGEIVPALLTSDDKWILLKLDQAIREITDAFAEYRFNEATPDPLPLLLERILRLVRRGQQGRPLAPRPEPADHHPPSSRPTPQPPRPRVAAPTLSPSSTSFSPIPCACSIRSCPSSPRNSGTGWATHEDMPPDQGGQTIMYAPWPKPLDEDFRAHYGLDEACLAAVNAKYDLVTQGRDLRRQANLPASKKVKFLFQPAQPPSPHEAEVLKLLLNAEALKLNPAGQPARALRSSIRTWATSTSRSKARSIPRLNKPASPGNSRRSSVKLPRPARSSTTPALPPNPPRRCCRSTANAWPSGRQSENGPKRPSWPCDVEPDSVIHRRASTPLDQ